MFDEEKLKKIYVNFRDARKVLINPIVEPDNMYIENWCKSLYEKKLFQEDTIEIFSNNGERVRSKSEKIIADLLLSNKVQKHHVLAAMYCAKSSLDRSNYQYLQCG